ncbi:Scr1 family TA system antitoxin-like transcriptional regulator [Streptomyces sp. NPDC020299]|uniref:Scr1 family TA system antitoxin-like transcriptional regulator n=1 Tax=Streptomyces sp. NPDC020299 TaxID=3365067 RepID=UPI0037BD8F28
MFRALGRQIEVARERAGLSQKELGDRIGYGEETISSVERGRRTPQPELLVAVDRLLECGGLLASAAEDVERAKTRRRVRHPEWFRDYARLEEGAVELHDYSSLAIPGLLQTDAHTNVVFGTRQPAGRTQVAYLEVQHISRLIADPNEVRILAARYGSIRAQALTPEESLTLIEKMPGDR